MSTELYYYYYLNVFLWYYFNVNCAESKDFFESDLILFGMNLHSEHNWTRDL